MVWVLSPPKRRVVRRRNFARRRVQTMSKTSTGFYKGVVVTKNNISSTKKPQCKPTIRSAVLIALLLTAQAAYRHASV